MRYGGSKYKLSRRLVRLIPPGVTHYYEPCLGWGQVYQRIRSGHLDFQYYHLNDIDADVMAFWQCIQSGEFAKRHAIVLDKLTPELDHEDEIKAEYVRCKWLWINRDDPYAWYFLYCYAIGQRVFRDHNLRPNVASMDYRLIGNGLTDSLEKMEQLRAWINDRTTLTCGCGIELLKNIPNERDHFAYIDPSYPALGTTDRLYPTELSDAQHRDLCDVLTSARFRWLLSIAIYPLTRELYSKFNPLTIEYTSSGRGLLQRQGRGKRPKECEWAVCNY